LTGVFDSIFDDTFFTGTVEDLAVLGGGTVVFLVVTETGGLVIGVVEDPLVATVVVGGAVVVLIGVVLGLFGVVVALIGAVLGLFGVVTVLTGVVETGVFFTGTDDLGVSAFLDNCRMFSNSFLIASTSCLIEANSFSNAVLFIISQI